MISDLVAILRRAGIKPTAEELADIFWLALQIDAPKQSADAIPRPKEQLESDEKISQERDSVPEIELPDISDPVSHSHRPPLGSDVHISSQRKRKERETKGSKMGALPIQSPAAPALADTLGISRALRPLMQRTPSRIHSTLDEVRTAEYIAEQGIWVPVLKPASEHWLELALVVDDSRSMIIWRRTIEHLQLVLERQGAFRDVRVWQLATSEDGNDVQIRTGVGRTVNQQIGRSPKELLDPNGRRLILVVSDCVSLAWSQGTMSRLLSVWGHSGPVALIQVLPQWLWSRSVLGDAVEGVLRASLPVLPNVQLDFIPSNYLVEKEDVKGWLPLPVVTLERKTLGQWTQALMSMENIWAPGYMFDIQAKAYGLANKQQGGESLPITPEQRIKRFRATASQTARMLVGLLAATPLINLQVIRLIQDAMLPHSEQGHVAEVLLGGLLEQLPMEEGAIEPEFDFFDGVRELLLNAMPTNISLEVIAHVSEYVEARFGQFLDLSALVEDPTLIDGGVIDEESEPFLRITAKILRRLGGEYTALALQLEEGVDEQKRLITAGTNDSHMQKDEQTVGMRLLDELDRSADRRKYDEDGELVSLDLSRLDLSELSSEIGQFTTLQELYLTDNQLGKLPKEVGKLTALRRLGLSGNRLTQVPMELCQLSNLQELDLNNNQLTQVPVELCQLSNLQTLGLDNNQLTQIPVELCQLSNLQTLGLSNNQLRQVPAELAQLSNLQTLYLDKNHLREVPSELWGLSNLQVLGLSENQLKELPGELGQLRSLQKLYLGKNELRKVPSELWSLTSLQILKLNGNQLSLLPTEVCQLSGLQELDLSGNRLGLIPPEVGQLTNLQTLKIDDMPTLLTPPPEIVARGTGDMLAFLRALQKSSVPQYEAKLLLVGEGGTGKSSLSRALRAEVFDPHLSTTHGIEVDHLKLPESEIILNMWDFGGQQIYHATHQFFFTKRSLYVLVWSARLGAEQGRLAYWLDTIKSLAPDARIVLVATYVDERAPDLNYQFYKGLYPQLVGNLSVSNKLATGLIELEKTLLDQAAQLPLIGQPWPMNWLDVEKALLFRPEYYIGADEYTRCCAACGVEADIANGTLGNYLHDLGKILYFRDDDILSNLVVLKPNWVTKAISRVLDDETTSKAKGILRHSELPRIWGADEDGLAYERYLYPAFLRLMERFELSYQIEADLPGRNSTSSLIPLLLPHEPPENLPAWPKRPPVGHSQVEMVYHLDSVPAGIMSRFIVRTQQYTKNLHWREGVMLEYQGHQARVELNLVHHELHLIVQGPLPQNFFTILTYTVEVILARFEGLTIRREIPCTCHWEREGDDPCPRTYRYEDLIQLMQDRKYTIECPETFAEVSVPLLLYGIHSSTTEQVMRDIQQGQESIKHAVQQDLRELQRRVEQQSELIVRDFTRQWNLEMQKLEAECPNTFVLTLGSGSAWNPKNWVSQEYQLYLVCQHPSGPHRVGEGYSVRKAGEWWKNVRPWLNRLVTFFKYGVPLGKVIGVVYDAVDTKSLEDSIDLMDEIVNDVPEFADENSVESLDTQMHLSESQQAVGPALRTLYNFLKEADPAQFWGGLSKVMTPDGNIFWLCETHRKQYESRVLRLDG